MTTKTLKPSIKLIKHTEADTETNLLMVELSEGDVNTNLPVSRVYPLDCLHALQDEDEQLVSYHLFCQEDSRGETWRAIKTYLSLSFIGSGEEPYQTAYRLFKLYFEPQTAFYKGEAYAIDPYRKLYTALGTILTPPEDSDDSWMEEYSEANEEQAKELILWMY